MTPKILPTLAALTTIAALAPVGAAVARSAAPTTVPSIDVVQAYAYKDTTVQKGRTYATVVLRTKAQLPRRYDGMIRAAGFFDGVGHSIASVGGAHGKAAHCYMFSTAVVGGHVAGLDGRSAKLGSTHTVKVTARGDHGDISDSIRVTLRRAKAGDRSGRPLGC